MKLATGQTGPSTDANDIVTAAVAIGTFETPIGQGTPYHKFAITHKDGTLTYHAFSYGVVTRKKIGNVSGIFTVLDNHVGDGGGIESLLEDPPGDVLSGGVLHFTNNNLSFGTEHYDPKSSIAKLPGTPSIVIEKFLPLLEKKYSAVHPVNSVSLTGCGPSWELWNGIIHPVYLKAVGDVKKNIHMAESLAVQTHWKKADSGTWGYWY